MLLATISGLAIVALSWGISKVYRSISKVYPGSSFVGTSSLKAVCDFVFSLLILLAASPVLLLIAAIIKIVSPGPVFYFQERVGQNGKLFNIIKFRTMHVDAETKSGPVWCGRFDDRVFSFGAFLRHHHIDEFPQFINVLKGEMSIVGPRPERPFFVQKFAQSIAGYTHRTIARPGITGLAQILQSYDSTPEDVKRKIRLDIHYVKNCSFILDAAICWYTLSVMFRGRLLSGEISEKIAPAAAVENTFAESNLVPFSLNVFCEVRSFDAAEKEPSLHLLP